MAIHLTPTELAREAGMERREVIEKCMELGVPIFQGRIDKTLFWPTSKSEHAPGSARDPRRVARRRGRIAPRQSRRSEECRRHGGPAQRGTGRPRSRHREPGRRALWRAPAARFKRDGEWRRCPTRARRDRLRDRPRADRPRARSRATASRCCARPASSGPTRTSRSRRRRRRRPDLPDQLARGVRVGGGQLRVALRRLRGRRAGGEDRAVRDSCPSSRRSSRSSRPRARSRWTSCASAAAGATRAQVSERGSPRSSPEDPVHDASTPRAHRPPKGLRAHAHGNLSARVTRMCEGGRTLIDGGRGDVYLYLPLAHSYAHH
jgi:hypothetical protein